MSSFGQPLAVTYTRLSCVEEFPASRPDCFITGGQNFSTLRADNDDTCRTGRNTLIRRTSSPVCRAKSPSMILLTNKSIYSTVPRLHEPGRTASDCQGFKIP